jgi:hypothetical protein
MPEDSFLYMIDSMLKTCKWFALQALLFFLMPYVWDYEYSASTLVLILVYTMLYALYWNFVPTSKQVRLLSLPYLAYVVIGVVVYFSTGDWCTSLWQVVLLPLYGAGCFVGVKLFKKGVRKLRNRFRWGGVVAYTSLALFFILLKASSVAWMRAEAKEDERADILERRDYLLDKLVTSPKRVIDEMPSAVGTQFQGEWALYSCSMLSAALTNISTTYPDTRDENLRSMEELIEIVLSPELRYYDSMRWGEDPLESLDGDNSHVSYLSHLAWMICGYKRAGGDGRYDELLDSLCSAMNRRILRSEALNLPTYPGELIYVPDMLVAIVALEQYADLTGGTYRSTVTRWVSRAQREWIDAPTGVLVSFLTDCGEQVEGMPVKGSYSALNCYYLTLVDEAFARKQYEMTKTLFWKGGVVAGLKEYHDLTCFFGFDIDAGPILLELSPSGTAFFAGPASYFDDTKVENAILRTAEAAGHTVVMGHQRHYLLANVALVGESIMLAMRTHR